MSPIVNNIKTGLKGLKGAGDVIRGTALQAADDFLDSDPNHPKTAAKHEKNRMITEQGKAQVRDVDYLIGRRERAKAPDAAPYNEPTTAPVPAGPETGKHGGGTGVVNQEAGVAGATTGGLYQDTGITGTARPSEGAGRYANTGLQQETGVAGTAGTAYGERPATHAGQEVPAYRAQEEGLAQQEGISQQGLPPYHIQEGGLGEKDSAAYRAQEEGFIGQEIPSYRPQEGLSHHTQHEHGLDQHQEIPSHRVQQEGLPRNEKMQSSNRPYEHDGETAYPDQQHEMPAAAQQQHGGIPSYPTRQQGAGPDGMPTYQTTARPEFPPPPRQEAPSSHAQHAGLGSQHEVPPYASQREMPGQQQRHM
ncbi:hypothetical protein Micbo1qcDRAFT_70698 [Microdochium bolleyi]|uniref:Uncharacterized protein n=1 Tax=Microdochium bolleyi TaxID=196109 RepID=A0A136IZW4_9PEZI|nr:hypothetical protein Micbo1qcDRAFT_70698 [Microdochium bolleyi]